jgi:hypothetical protein
VLTWPQFAALRPDLAEAGRALLYQFDVGLGFLATTRADGGPRVHPMCPIMTEAGMYAFIVRGPKQRDLLRDGRYALHSFPCPDNEDAFSCMGSVREVANDGRRHELSDVFVHERAALAVPAPRDDEIAFELLVDSCLLTRTTGHGDPNPVHQIWRAT